MCYETNSKFKAGKIGINGVENSPLFRILDFEFVLNFVLRISNFSLSLHEDFLLPHNVS